MTLCLYGYLCFYWYHNVCYRYVSRIVPVRKLKTAIMQSQIDYTLKTDQHLYWQRHICLPTRVGEIGKIGRRISYWWPIWVENCVYNFFTHLNVFHFFIFFLIKSKPLSRILLMTRKRKLLTWSISTLELMFKCTMILLLTLTISVSINTLHLFWTINMIPHPAMPSPRTQTNWPAISLQLSDVDRQEHRLLAATSRSIQLVTNFTDEMHGDEPTKECGYP